MTIANWQRASRIMRCENRRLHNAQYEIDGTESEGDMDTTFTISNSVKHILVHVNTTESSVYILYQLQYIRQAFLLGALQLLVSVYKRLLVILFSNYLLSCYKPVAWPKLQVFIIGVELSSIFYLSLIIVLGKHG